MTNNEQFNVMLNSCENPRAVYGALSALGSAGEYCLIGMSRESKGPGKALEAAIGMILKAVTA